MISYYGSLEQFSVRRYTENETAFQMRKSYFRPLGMAEHCHDLFDRVKASGRVRDVVLKEYTGQDHAGVAASAITDGSSTSLIGDQHYTKLYCYPTVAIYCYGASQYAIARPAPEPRRPACCRWPPSPRTRG
jgi:hypothetical protein